MINKYWKKKKNNNKEPDKLMIVMTCLSTSYFKCILGTLCRTSYEREGTCYVPSISTENGGIDQ